MCVSKDRKPAPQEALPDVLPMPSYWYQQYDGRSFVLLHQGYH